MSTIFVLHETGRSLSLMAIARKLLEQNPEEKITFLLVGNAAKDLFEQLEDSDSLKNTECKSYSDFEFSAEVIKHLEDHPLNADQLETIKKYLSTLAIDKVIIGSPSWLKAMAPFQIAEALAELVTPATGFIYDGDFYQEYGCAYWTVLKQPDTDTFAWRRKFTWLACLPGSKALMPEFDPPLSVKVVGDPSLDNAINAEVIASDLRQKIRAELSVKSDQELLVVQASKYIDDDMQLVKHLLTKKLDDQFQIRILLHKGTRDFNAHVRALLSLIQSDNIKIVVNYAYKNRISNEFYASNHLISSERKGEIIADVADRLCSTIPGTQATKSAIKGIPVFCELTQHVSYLPKGRIKVGEDGLAEFLSADKVLLPALSRTDLGLTKEATADIVCGLVNPKKKSSVYGTTLDPTLFGGGVNDSTSVAEEMHVETGMQLRK